MHLRPSGKSHTQVVDHVPVLTPQADVPQPPLEEQQQLMQLIQKQARLLEQARALEAQQRAATAKVRWHFVC